jgi:hypothetical protein
MITVRHLTAPSGAIYSNCTCFRGSVLKFEGFKEEYVKNIDWVICFSNLSLGDNIKMIFAVTEF